MYPGITYTLRNTERDIFQAQVSRLSREKKNINYNHLLMNLLLYQVYFEINTFRCMKTNL